MSEDGSQNTDGTQDNTDGSGGESTSTPSFHDSLPEGIRAHESLKDFSDAGTLAQSYLDLQGKVPVIPESHDGYKLDLPQNASKERVAEFTKWAHEHGLTQAQVDAMVKQDMQRTAAAAQAMKDRAKAKLAKDQKQLQEDWGDNFKENSELAEKAMAAFLGEDGQKAWKKAGLLENIHVIKLFHEFGTKISEDQWVSGKGSKPTSKYQNEFGEPVLEFPNTPNMKG